MKANPSEFQIMCLGQKDMSRLCPASRLVELLVVNVDNSLKFEVVIKEPCRKINQKVHAFGRLRPFLGEQMSKLLLISVVMSNFSYYPIIWLFCCKRANNEINKSHKRALRALYGDYESKFEELSDKDKSMTIREKNLQILMVEIYKTIKHGIPG